MEKEINNENLNKEEQLEINMLKEKSFMDFSKNDYLSIIRNI